MGAWIEIIMIVSKKTMNYVAPLVGAWIEILMVCARLVILLVSLPSWERGLKCNAVSV